MWLLQAPVLLMLVSLHHHPCPPRRAPSLDVFLRSACACFRVRACVRVLLCYVFCPHEVTFCIGRSC